jgi:hypothetical protein
MVTKKDLKKLKKLVKLADSSYYLKKNYINNSKDRFGIKILDNYLILNQRLNEWLNHDNRLYLIDRKDVGYVLIITEKLTDDCVDIFLDSNGVCETSDDTIRTVKSLFNISDTERDNILDDIIGVGIIFKNFAFVRVK